MKRREFITFLGGAAATWPLAARAQQAMKSYRIGMLETISPALNAAQLDAFRKGLRELGYVEGINYAIEYRSADGRAERFPELAAELVRLCLSTVDRNLIGDHERSSSESPSGPNAGLLWRR